MPRFIAFCFPFYSHPITVQVNVMLWGMFKHTPRSQAELCLGAIKSFLLATDLHTVKWSEPSSQTSVGFWVELLTRSPESATRSPPSVAASILVSESVTANLFVIASFSLSVCKSWDSLGQLLPFLPEGLPGGLFSTDPLGRGELRPWYFVTFPLQMFKEWLSHSISSWCCSLLESSSTSSILSGVEDPAKLPHGLLLLLLLRDSLNLTWACLFAWTQWLSSVEDESEVSELSSLHLGLETWRWKSFLLPFACSSECSCLWETLLLLLGFCFTGFWPDSFLAWLSTMTGLQCSNASSDMSCKVEDLDKEDTRQRVGNGNGKESHGKTKRERGEEWWKWQHGQKCFNKDRLKKN